MQRMEDGFIDLTVTSPPYDNLRDYNGYHFPFEEIARSLYRVTKEGGVVVWVVGDQMVNGSETGTSFRQALYFITTGFRLNDTMIFRKTNPFPTDTRYRYSQCFEFMFIFSKGRNITFNALYEPTKSKRKYKSSWGRDSNDKMIGNTGAQKITKSMKIRDNIFDYAISIGGATKNKDAFKHPAIFPEKLAHDHIRSWSNENDVVYDPFMGSGTTAAMCIKLQRQYIGSEISKEYCLLAEKRIQNEKSQGRFNLAV